MENNSLFRPGAADHAANMVSKELQQTDPQSDPKKVDEEVRQYMAAELAKGRDMDEIIMDLVELSTADKSKQREILLSLRSKIDNRLEGAGKEFDLTNS